MRQPESDFRDFISVIQIFSSRISLSTSRLMASTSMLLTFQCLFGFSCFEENDTKGLDGVIHDYLSSQYTAMNKHNCYWFPQNGITGLVGEERQDYIVRIENVRLNEEICSKCNSYPCEVRPLSALKTNIMQNASENGIVYYKEDAGGIGHNPLLAIPIFHPLLSRFFFARIWIEEK